MWEVEQSQGGTSGFDRQRTSDHILRARQQGYSQTRSQQYSQSDPYVTTKTCWEKCANMPAHDIPHRCSCPQYPGNSSQFKGNKSRLGYCQNLLTTTAFAAFAPSQPVLVLRVVREGGTACSSIHADIPRQCIAVSQGSLWPGSTSPGLTP